MDRMNHDKTKLAIKLKTFHGTNGRWPTLVPRFGGANAKIEANAPAVFTAANTPFGKQEAKKYARGTTKKRGGFPTVASVKVDTDAGWAPSGFTQKAKNEVAEEIGGDATLADMREWFADIVEEADGLKARIRAARKSGAKPSKEDKERLGRAYKKLNQAAGSWANPKPVKAGKYKDVK